MNKKQVSGEMLSGVRAAESSLARRDYSELEDGLPEGHPLREQVEQFKTEMGGDLSGLPESHPLIVQMKAAKERYDSDIAEETEDAQKKAREVKKAKKLDRQKARRESIAHEEQQHQKRREAATALNGEITKMLDGIRGMYKTIAEHEESLSVHPISRARVLRLKRMLVAVERGLADSKMGRV